MATDGSSGGSGGGAPGLGSRPIAVRFAAQVRVSHIPHVCDMSEDEVAARWLSGRDFDDIQREIVLTVRSMRRSPAQDDEPALVAAAMTSRGLEHLRSPAHLEQRKINKDCNLHAVLNEQERLKAGGGGIAVDADELAKASALSSMWARDLALQTAEKDAAVVEAERRILRAAIRIRGGGGTGSLLGSGAGAAALGMKTKDSWKDAAKATVSAVDKKDHCLTVLRSALDLAVELTASHPSSNREVTTDRAPPHKRSATAAAAACCAALEKKPKPAAVVIRPADSHVHSPIKVPLDSKSLPGGPVGVSGSVCNIKGASGEEGGGGGLPDVLGLNNLRSMLMRQNYVSKNATSPAAAT